jgi:hypothetical protein
MSGTVSCGPLLLTIGDSFTISRSTGYHWFPTLKQIDSSRLLVHFWCSYDEINPAGTRTAFCWTADGGLTWEPPVTLGDAGHSWIRCSDGTCLWLSYQVLKTGDTSGHCRVGRSADGRSYEWSEGHVDLAPHRLGDRAHGAGSVVFARSILEAPDGSLLASMYGRLGDDTSDRSFLVRSTDGGDTWQFFATIGYRADIGGEGLDEPCVARLANGELFCMMRNNSRAPMWSSRASDEGGTWSLPVRTPEYAASVFPDLCLMSNGILACSFGRPGCHLMFSLDGTGERWSDRVTLYSGPSTCYTAIREVAPGKLLYIHDVTPAGWNPVPEGQFNEIHGTFIAVTRNDS